MGGTIRRHTILAGGNLDYSGVREGTTVYLPVHREGALR